MWAFPAQAINPSSGVCVVPVFPAAGRPAACPAAIAAVGPHPAAPALVTGVATWLVLTARHDLAPPGSR
jgi:hypothetical protein